MKKFLAIDQYGNKCLCDHPRKDLTALHCVKHADKMYMDKNGESVHVGYVICSHWYEVMRLAPMGKL